MDAADRLPGSLPLLRRPGGRRDPATGKGVRRPPRAAAPRGSPRRAWSLSQTLAVSMAGDCPDVKCFGKNEPSPLLCGAAMWTAGPGRAEGEGQSQKALLSGSQMP